VKNGYNAYGKYRNSENLDRLKDHNALMANSLASVGAGPVIKAPIHTNTSFRRLDPSFLHQGEAARVAAEFERETGMKREDFLTQMADISEKKIKRSDPMMIDKAFSRFEGFLKKIPNAEFRKNAEKSIALVPNTMRRGMVAQAVQKLAGFFADAGAGTATPLDSTITDLAPAKLASAGAGAPGAADGKAPAADASRNPAALAEAAAPAPEAPAAPSASGREEKSGFENVVTAALETQGQDHGAGAGLTIFQQVSQRYRILTPSLAKAAN
jgi:hypothetical protein